jgi:hypothetical protein
MTWAVETSPSSSSSGSGDSGCIMQTKKRDRCADVVGKKKRPVRHSAVRTFMHSCANLFIYLLSSSFCFHEHESMHGRDFSSPLHFHDSFINPDFFFFAKDDKADKIKWMVRGKGKGLIWPPLYSLYSIFPTRSISPKTLRVDQGRWDIEEESLYSLNLNNKEIRAGHSVFF